MGIAPASLTCSDKFGERFDIFHYLKPEKHVKRLVRSIRRKNPLGAGKKLFFKLSFADPFLRSAFFESRYTLDSMTVRQFDSKLCRDLVASRFLKLRIGAHGNFVHQSANLRVLHVFIRE